MKTQRSFRSYHPDHLFLLPSDITHVIGKKDLTTGLQPDSIGSLGIPIKVIFINNRADGMVRNIQAISYHGQFTATERHFSPDFANIAKECGFKWCRKIRKSKELESSMNDFLSADGPCLLEVVTDREEGIYPLIPQGKGYRDMILGPNIREIEA